MSPLVPQPSIRRGALVSGLLFSLFLSACTLDEAAEAPIPTVPTVDSGSTTSSSPGPHASTTSNTPDPPVSTSTTTQEPITLVPGDFYREPFQSVMDELKSRGFLVTAYEVCSGSVGRGEVRQIVLSIGGDEVELLGANGITDAGTDIPPNSLLEIKVGSGSTC